MAQIPNGVNEGEAVVPVANGQFLIFQGYEMNVNGTEYVRFIDAEGKEILYYDKQEWVDEPEEVMGCIMAAIQNGAIKT